MSKSTLFDAVKNLELQHHLSPYQQKKCEDYFRLLKVNDYVYPGHLKSKMALDIKVVYAMLEELRRQGYLSYLFEVYCYDCNKSKGKFIGALTEFDSNWHCDFCDSQLTPEDNCIVLYKVISL